MKLLRIIILWIFISLTTYFYIFKNKETYSNKIKIIKHFKTPKENRGLMFIKDKLPENSGALFDYSNNPQRVSFWMKNTFIPNRRTFFR